MELSNIQKQIVETNREYVLVNSCAGSGKTRCLVHRLKFLLDSGIEPSKIVAITFTNAAAEEILERLARPTGLFVGTIHGYANQLLLRGGVDTSDILDKDKVNALIQGVVFENPALVDPITGRVYDLSYVMLRGGQQRLENATKFTGLPLWDSPLIIIEKNAFDWTACQLPEGYVPFVDHVGI